MLPDEGSARLMDTPCVNVCVIDTDTGLCAGCGRSIEEIAGWAAMTDGERKRIMRALPHRRRRSPPRVEK